MLDAKNPDAPHQFHLTIIVEVLERDCNGQMFGMPKKRMSALYSRYGKNLEDCEKQLQEFLKEHKLEVK